MLRGFQEQRAGGSRICGTARCLTAPPTAAGCCHFRHAFGFIVYLIGQAGFQMSAAIKFEGDSGKARALIAMPGSSSDPLHPNFLNYAETTLYPVHPSIPTSLFSRNLVFESTFPRF
ncbi:uncharacterized protein BDZ99DRAFT_24293 [Mytilinidion resinicola]|uniref:Uncharacterized protein n=1 Tax=Mytilinidion resinicola TaxID=574789 RepID=A0A6A6ZAG8_9PEZI|nr:uncharacterized protein BDZ99DRAFT_24293 [Mytilinidion resinicola]KAF2817828.1 hypothetical protein BDZ99DRAFT_24293 [Mytilinidion resinicola]